MVWMTRKVSVFNLKWKNFYWPFVSLIIRASLIPGPLPWGARGRGYISAKVKKYEQTSTFIAMYYQGYMSIRCTLLLPECITCHSFLLALSGCDIWLWQGRWRPHWPCEVLQKGQSWEASDCPERPGQSQLGHTTSVLRRKIIWLWVWGFILFLTGVSDASPEF